MNNLVFSNIPFNGMHKYLCTRLIIELKFSTKITFFSWLYFVHCFAIIVHRHENNQLQTVHQAIAFTYKYRQNLEDAENETSFVST